MNQPKKKLIITAQPAWSLILILLISNIQNCYSDCLVGDIVYLPGQSIGEIGLECINSTSYDAIKSECGADGNITESETVSTCPSVVQNCVQCGPRGSGAALCLSTETTDSDCGESETTTPEVPPDSSSPSSCVVEADCPIPDDSYCGYHCVDGTCAMWCESEHPGLQTDSSSMSSVKEVAESAGWKMDYYMNTLLWPVLIFPAFLM